MITATSERGIMTSGTTRLRVAARGITTMGTMLALAIVVAPSPSAAQVRMTVPPQSQPIALRGATIHTVTNGVIENGTILFENGVITAVGTDVTIPSGARVVDVGGKHIYPGLIDAYTTVGISEIGAVEMSNDVREVGDFNPKMKATLNAIGAGPGKIHITYRKLIVKNAQFKPATAIPEVKINETKKN